MERLEAIDEALLKMFPDENEEYRAVFDQTLYENGTFWKEAIKNASQS